MRKPQGTPYHETETKMTYTNFLDAFINAVANAGCRFSDEMPKEALSYLQEALKAIDVSSGVTA